jgi:ubiquinone/menaquinone biosynthesis C-methylase UbiE
VLADGGDQARYFDESVDEEFEIERPRGTPRLHRWILAEKVRRGLRGVETELADAVVVAVCAGSGMDAEFLAGYGARVLAVDLSRGSARRMSARAERHRVEIAPVVADATRLPLADHSVDVAFVHDGLHHLVDPYAGLSEMARVARRMVSVSEPAQAAITAAAVRLGLADEYEEAGNRVERMELGRVAQCLEEHGFRVVHAERYGLFYRHEPGRLVRVMSRPVLLDGAVAGLRLVNAIGGRFGNKLALVAVRS